MAGPQIKLNTAGFSDAWATQRLALSDFTTASNDEQKALSTLGNSWKGAGGVSFQTCAKELSAEMLAGLFSVTVLSDQITQTQNIMTTTDANIAASLSKRVSKRAK
jgi:uncharacterized protein YukE